MCASEPVNPWCSLELCLLACATYSVLVPLTDLEDSHSGFHYSFISVFKLLICFACQIHRGSALTSTFKLHKTIHNKVKENTISINKKQTNKHTKNKQSKEKQTSTNETTKQRTKIPSILSTNQPTNQLTEQSMKRPTDQPTNRPTSPPVN